MLEQDGGESGIHLKDYPPIHTSIFFFLNHATHTYHSAILIASEAVVLSDNYDTDVVRNIPRRITAFPPIAWEKFTVLLMPQRKVERFSQPELETRSGTRTERRRQGS